VAEGLLAPYQTKVDCCASGEESVKLALDHQYDIIFMDHMMPGMDGIEAAAAIRALEKPGSPPLSIIALTANAVSGMREMFLSKGFNDYLSKPIEISKLDDIMGKWIPAEKKIRSGGSGVKNGEKSPVPNSPPLTVIGVDTAKGLVMTGGSEQGYRNVLRYFCQDVEDRLPLLEKIPGEDTVALFTTNVHALKGAAATIGAAALSQQAAELEAAGKSGNLEIIREKLPAFYQFLKETAKNIRDAVTAVEPEAAAETPVAQNDPQLHDLLSQLKSALETKNMKEIDRLLAGLEALPMDAHMRNKIAAVSDKVLITEFTEALDIINKLMLPEV
jgi:CheY-like chemotaxis protein